MPIRTDDEGVSYTITAEDRSAEGVESAKRRLIDLSAANKKATEMSKLGFWGMGDAGAAAFRVAGLAAIERVNYLGSIHARLSQKEANEAERSITLMHARGESMAAIYEAELIAFDSVTDSKLKAAKTLDEADEIYKQREAGREIKTIEHGRIISQMRSQREANAAERSVTLMRARGESMSAIHEAEIVAFNSVTDSKLKAAKTLDEADEIYKQREAERLIMLAEQEKNTAALRIHIAQNMAGTLAGTFNTLYKLQGGNARKFFEMYKAVAISETIIATYKGAQAAYAEGAKFGPWVGAAYAAVAVAAGVANVAKIRAQQFSDGGGAVGANRTAGSPENGGYKYFSWEQSHYGTGWRPGEGPPPGTRIQTEEEPQQRGGTTIIINAMDAKSFEQYCKENPNGINAAVQQNIKDGGETRRTIRRYV